MPKARVLAVDDQRYFRELIEEFLTAEGFEAQTAASGEEALHLLERSAFDIVLTDVNMPRLNGYDLAKALRELGCTTPIIGATANALRGEEALCLAAGMNHCLIKPFTLRALFTALAPYERASYEAL